MSNIVRFRAERDRSYTTINNTIFRDVSISLKAKGLFALVMSLPESWDFSVAGLESIVKEGRDALYAAIEELKRAGFVEVEDVRTGGRFAGTQYVFLEIPRAETPGTKAPDTDSPYTGFPDTVSPYTENPQQLSKDIKNKRLNKGTSASASDNPSLSTPAEPAETKHTGRPPIVGMVAVNQAAEDELHSWLDAAAEVLSVGHRSRLAGHSAWEQAAMAAIDDGYDLQAWRKTIKDERARLADSPQFFSPSGCLKVLQLAPKAAAAPVAITDEELDRIQQRALEGMRNQAR